MLAGIGQVLIEVVLTVFTEFICYALGRLVVFIFSFGRWTCEGLNSNRQYPKGRFLLPIASVDGRRHLSAEAAQMIGLLTFILLVMAVILAAI
jgi:hypothetical protein